MEWDNDLDLSTRQFSSRLIVEQALKRGWSICGFKSNLSIFILYPEGREGPGIKIFSASPPQMSFPASKIAKDKYITNQILSSDGLPVPAELLVSYKEPNMLEVSEFMNLHKKVVVKPLDASHGKGITVGVSSTEKLKIALKVALEASSRGRGVIQEQVKGHDIRVLCIDYKFINSITRIPAFIIGDGSSTIKQLIENTNASEDRGENYKARLNFIPLQKAEEFLGSDKLNSVPNKGEHVQAIGVSNVGMGGERRNITNQIPDFLKLYAERAARSLELPVCGVDFMVSELPTTESTVELLDPKIIEVNECPMLTMYEDLYSSEQAVIIDKYLDFAVSG